MSNAAGNLHNLRQARNAADYSFRRSIDEAAAIYQVGIATDIIRLLHHLANEPTILADIVEAIKRYEREILREATWHP